MLTHLADRKTNLEVAPHIEDIWGTEEAQNYELFALGLETDLVPYFMTSRLIRQDLEERGLAYNRPSVLDVGSFTGKSTRSLAQDMPWARFVGFDSNASSIQTAQDSNEYKNVLFRHVPSDEPLPDNLGKFDCATATFVHPTISNAAELAFTLQKVADSLKSGAMFIMLGLHRASLETKDIHYQSYGHYLEADAEYVDGQPLNNVLKREDGSEFAFYDYCWTDETMEKMMREAGFASIKFVGVTLDSEEYPEISKLLRSAISNCMSREDRFDLVEWKIPLYQLIIARKA